VAAVVGSVEAVVDTAAVAIKVKDKVRAKAAMEVAVRLHSSCWLSKDLADNPGYSGGGGGGSNWRGQGQGQGGYQQGGGYGGEF